MKKILLLIVLVSLVTFICSCNNNRNIEPDAQNSSTYLEHESNTVQNRNSAICTYVPFDDLLKDVTTLVVGEYRGVNQRGELYYYEFYITKDIRDSGMDRTIISVQSLPAECYMAEENISYSTYDIKYETGKEYLLLLKCYSSVYSDNIAYSFVSDSLIIPMDSLSNRANSIDRPTLYGTYLRDHLTSQQAVSEFDKSNFPSYVLDKIKNNSYDLGKKYEQETDLRSVVINAEYIFKIRVGSLFMVGYEGGRITYDCDLIEAYKGDIQNKRFYVTFPIDTVKEGDICIVTVRDVGGSQTLFGMSSKNSVFDVSQKEEILDILNN